MAVDGVEEGWTNSEQIGAICGRSFVMCDYHGLIIINKPNGSVRPSVLPGGTRAQFKPFASSGGFNTICHGQLFGN